MNAATTSEIMMFSTFSGPFSEENEISGQVVKSIYTENQVYNDQIQRTGQAMVSCTAVRTELETVSASTEINPSTSNTISSCHAEVPLQYHINLSSPIQQHSSTQSIEQETYNKYELLSDSSDNNSNISTTYINTTQRTNINFYPNPVEIYDPSICYNKFLYHHRLQSLPSPQTVGSFLTYLQEEYSMFYTEQYIRISIKYSRIDYVFEEAHIYLPQEFLLPNHFFVPFEDFHLFYKALLKSDNPTFNIPINNIENELFINNAELSTSTIIPQPNYSSHTTLQPNNSSQALDLTIATHNVQGYNTPLKRQLWEEFCLSNNIQICSITETKLSDSKPKKIL